MRHDVVDIYVPLSGGQLALQIRRNLISEDWNTSNEWTPDLYPDRPFGTCWTSNVAPVIEFLRTQPILEQDGTVDPKLLPALDESYAIVTDENGLKHRFVITFDGNNEIFIPLPNERGGHEFYMNKLEASVLVTSSPASMATDWNMHPISR